jgi:hypothetical protein
MVNWTLGAGREARSVKKPPPGGQRKDATDSGQSPRDFKLAVTYRRQKIRVRRRNSLA